MKKTMLLTLALALAGASSLMASTVDVYITGSTAFRANCYTACTKLYSSAPNIYYANAANGGANSGFSSKTASWVMTGTPITALTNLQGDTLVIHGLFTGSIQGIQSVENNQQLIWAAPVGTLNGNATAYVTNSPTIAFSDSSSTSVPYPLTANTAEETVCVQPFVVAKSAIGGVMNNINNITWDQLDYGIPVGQIPLSAWTYKLTDSSNFVYLVQRTADSGTRRTETSSENYLFTDTVGVYIYDSTNNIWYSPSNTIPLVQASQGSTSTATNIQVVGTEGPGNGGANLAWGPGYIGGGDIATELGLNNSNNQAIAYLSMNDSRAITSTNWSQVISFEGLWPTAAGANITSGTSTTNDYSPITEGFYPCWGYEVLVHLVDPSLDSQSDQDISENQLGSQTQPGSFLGVFNAQTFINGGSPVVGSIENEIELSKTVAPYATAIRWSDMKSNRSAVGGVISPF
ncbi:MAG: hypothetical protein WAO21_08250 [Verrucomicrobiia bacterium]